MIVTDTKLASLCKILVILDSNREYFLNVMLDFGYAVHDLVFNLQDVGNTREDAHNIWQDFGNARQV